MTIILLLLHVTVCLILILVVLLQTGKRADLAGAFGGGGSMTAFGARGAATFLSKATTWSAIIFMVTSIVLGIRLGSESTGSVVEDSGAPSAPALPAPSAPAEPAPQAPAEPAPQAPVDAPAGGESGQAPTDAKTPPPSPAP